MQVEENLKNNIEIENQIKESISQSEKEQKQTSDYYLFPCIRLNDNMNFYCLYSSNYNKWFVFDKILLLIVDYTDTDNFRFLFSTADSGPENKVRYECNDSEDLWNNADTQETTTQLMNRIKNFDEEQWKSFMIGNNDSLTENDSKYETLDNQTNLITDIQNYRYENFVLNKFKKKYLKEIIKLEDNGNVKFVKVIDFNIDYKENCLPRLLVSGQTIDIESEYRYFHCRFSDWKVSEKTNVIHFIGYVDELMLLSKNKKEYKKFKVLSKDEVNNLFNDVKMIILDKFNNFMKDLERNKSLFEEENYGLSFS